MPTRSNILKLKPLAEQVMVITGATSGIGLSTARAAAARGTKLVLAARNEDALKVVVEDLSHKGAKVASIAADVGVERDVRAIADLAVAKFGGFDTWVNNAGVSIVGPAAQTLIEDQRRLFETNYWGLVYGSLIAAEHFQGRPGGGALINVGSVLGDMALPGRGAYCASKHAVRAFTNALRMELTQQRAPVSLTLIKPSSIDTPLNDHARNLTGGPVTTPPPVYATPLVADAILYAAEHRAREITVGVGGRLISVIGALIPVVAEPVLAWLVPLLSRGKAGARAGLGDNLHQAGADTRERSFHKDVRETSLYSAIQMRPALGMGLAVLAGVVLVVALGGRGGRRRARA